MQNKEHDIDALFQDDADFDMRRHGPVQRTLFSTEEINLPKILNRLQKSHSAIHAVPAKQDATHSLNMRRLMDSFILATQMQVYKLKKVQPDIITRIKAERVSPMFEIRITELANLANITGKNYQRIYELLDQIYDLTMKWNVVGTDDSIEWEMKSRFFSTLGYGKGVKRGLIRFSYDPAVLEIILEPKNWAMLSLQAMRSLSTTASYALYQNAWRYIGTDHKITAPLPTEVWISLLCGSSRFVETDDNGKVTVNYADFKRRVLMDAIERVNSVPSLSYSLKLIEQKRGKRIARLQFKFIPKDGQQVLDLPMTWPDDTVEALEKIGYTKHEIGELSEGASLHEVLDALARLSKSERRFKDKGEKIYSRKRFFEGILNNVTAGSGDNKDAVDPDAMQEELRRQQAEEADKARRQKLEEGFSKHQMAKFASWISSLDIEERDALQALFLSTEEGRGAKKLSTKGASASPHSAFMRAFRSWLQKERPDTFEKVLTEPEDKTLEAWMAWRLEGGGAIDA